MGFPVGLVLEVIEDAERREAELQRQPSRFAGVGLELASGSVLAK